MSLEPHEGTYFNPDFLDLLEYFGPFFRLEWCNPIEAKLDVEWEEGEYESIEDFHRRSFIMLYHEIGLMSLGLSRQYIAQILDMTAGKANTSVLVVGGGSGQLGLALHTLGFKVSFADNFGQSLYFLAWRLRRRKLNRPIYILDDIDTVISEHHLAVCLDFIGRIEHQGRRLALLDRLADLGKIVMVNLPYQKGSGPRPVIDPIGLANYVTAKYGCFIEDYFSPYRDGIKPIEGAQPWERLLIYGKTVDQMVERAKKAPYGIAA